MGRFSLPHATQPKRERDHSCFHLKLTTFHAASAFAAAIFSSAVLRLFSSSILSVATDRSICLNKPVKTRPGPTSTNVFTPSSIISRTDSSQRTGMETCRSSALRASSPFSIVSASTLVTSGTRKSENCTFPKSFASFSCAGIISAEWKGAETGSITARFAPSCEAISVARFTAPAWPEITVCSGEFKFAAEQTSPSAARWHASATTACEIPITAAIAPTPCGTASCMYVPRLRTSCTASENFNPPAATSAEYSPRLCPATKSGFKPFSSATRKIATEHVKIAGCVFAVSFKSSSVPSKHIFEMENPNALSASSNTARAAGYFSASSLPMPGYCDAWPGNTNATFPMSSTSASWHAKASLARAACEQLLLNLLIHVGPGKARRDANRIFHGIGVRTAMADHANAAHSEQRRTAILGVINLLLQPTKRALRQHSRELRNQRTLQRLSHEGKKLKRQTFANLQRDVADEPIANNHVHFAREKIAAFHVPHIVQMGLLQPVVHFAGQFVSLNLFFPDREQTHPRPAVPMAKGHAVIYLAHHRELHQMLRLRIHVRTDIEQNAHAALGIWKRRRQRNSIHAFERAKQKSRDGHYCARVSRADDSVRLGFSYQPRRHMHRRILLPPECLSRVIVHRDHFAGRHNFDRQIRGRMLCQLGTDRRSLPNQQYAHSQLACGQHTAFDFGAGGVIPAHRVHGNRNHGDWLPLCSV